MTFLDFIQNLRSDSRITSFDESRTKQEIVLQLLQFLGWNVFNTDEVYPEYAVGSKRVDYSLRIDNQNKAFLEVKKVGEDLEKGDHQQQLLNYSFEQGVKLAILTNGTTWWFYLPLTEGTWDQRKFYSIDIYQQESQDIIARFQDFLYKDNIANGNAYKNAEFIYKSNQKQKILEETLPRAWNRIVSEPDSLLIDLINETTEKICGFKPEDDMIRDFILKHKFTLTVQTGIISKKPLRSPKHYLPKAQKTTVNYSNKKISYFRFKGTTYEVGTWKELLVKLCEIISSYEAKDFNKVLSVLSSYFNNDRTKLRKPQRVNNTNIFVETNLSANNIVVLCQRVMNLFDYSPNELEIGLKNDQ